MGTPLIDLFDTILARRGNTSKAREEFRQKLRHLPTCGLCGTSIFDTKRMVRGLNGLAYHNFDEADQHDQINSSLARYEVPYETMPYEVKLDPLEEIN